MKGPLGDSGIRLPTLRPPEPERLFAPEPKVREHWLGRLAGQPLVFVHRDFAQQEVSGVSFAQTPSNSQGEPGARSVGTGNHRTLLASRTCNSTTARNSHCAGCRITVSTPSTTIGCRISSPSGASFCLVARLTPGPGGAVRSPRLTPS